jgi:AcrR family transcriptional regulator
MTKPLSDEDIAAYRARLVQIAADLYAREGADAVTMRSLARAADTSRSTPYSYFRDKDEIIDCIRAVGFERLADVYLHAIASQTQPRNSLTAMGLAYVLFAARQPRLYTLMFERPIPQDSENELLQEAVDMLRQVAVIPLRECLTLGILHGDEDELSGTFWAMLHGLASLYLAGHFGGDEDDLVRRYRLMDVIIDGGFSS